MWRAAVLLTVVLLAGCQGSRGPLDQERWQLYSERFITPDGRVVDNGNGGISHSEGQGYAMLLATAAGDRATFERLWRWTEAHLAVREDGLFAWKWVPEAAPPIPDRNNATDGDLLIGWALGWAARRFNEPAYGRRAAAIAAALRQGLTRDTPFGPLLMPGAEGFEPDGRLVVNPSYFIFSAYRELGRWDDAAYWQSMVQSGERLLREAITRHDGLPPDWFSLAGTAMAPAPHAPLRFGFDALRVPLYVCWYGNEDRIPLAAIAAYWQRDDAAAWVDLGDSAAADIGLTPSHRAVQWLLARCLAETSDSAPPGPLADDYYGATLALLAEVAWMGRDE